jgi:hypothetical protein
MGSTYSAVHARGVSAAELAAGVTRALCAEGFTLLGEDGTAALERRVLIFASHGWGTVADEDHELDPELGDRWAQGMSRHHDTTVLAISVFHSDMARLSAWKSGEQLGAFQIPDDRKVDRKRAHKIVDTRFLAPLAEPALRAELEAGLIADRTLPEETTLEAARLLGVPNPGAGARHLWERPPAGAIKLRFGRPAEEEEDGDNGTQPQEQSAGMPGDPDGDIVLRVQEAAELCAGTPLFELITVHAEAVAGARINGIVVELSGPGLALLSVTELAGWNATQDTEINVVKPEVRPGVLCAAFPRNHIAPSSPPVMRGMSAADLRAWREALQAQAANAFYFHLRGHASQQGSGALHIRLLNMDGAPLEAQPATIALRVTRAPRMPILPSVPPEESPHDARNRVLAAQALDGNDWVQGWIGMDAPWDHVREWALDAASRLANHAALEGPLDVQLTTDGTHPPVRKTFEAGDHLARTRGFASLRKFLNDEASVVIGRTAQAEPDATEVMLQHQPRGTTLLDRATRADLARNANRALPRNVPVEITFSFRRGDGTTISQLVEQLFREAADLPVLVGAFVTAVHTVTGDNNFAFEELAQSCRSTDTVEVLSRRVRAPGWMVFAPTGAVQLLNEAPGIERTSHPAGVLLRSRATTPFTMTDDDKSAMERLVLRALPTREEILNALIPPTA